MRDAYHRHAPALASTTSLLVQRARLLEAVANAIAAHGDRIEYEFSTDLSVAPKDLKAARRGRRDAVIQRRSSR